MDPEGADERKQRQKEREAKWIETQIIGFTSLVNSFLSRRKQKIENLETDFKDGLRLADFIELAGHVELAGIDYFPKGKIQSIQNLAICLEYLSSVNVRLLGINAGTIYDGNLKLILGLLYSTIRNPHFTKMPQGESSVQADKGKQSFESQLLQWVQERVASYGLKATDFKVSFNDGKIFGALVHSIDSSAINLDSLNDDPTHNLNIVFDAALEKLQIPKLLAVEELTSGNPDERSIVLYATLLFHAAAAAGVKEEDSKIKTSLQKEQEEQKALETEMKALQNEIHDTFESLHAKALVADGLHEENERLKKLIDYYEHRAKVADSAIRALEKKAEILDQLGGDEDKKLLQNPNSNMYVDSNDAGHLVGRPNEPGDGSNWYFVPTDEDPHKFHLLQCKSGLFLSLESNEDGTPSRPSLSSELNEKSVWNVVDQKNAHGAVLQNDKTGEFLQLSPDGSVSVSESFNENCLSVKSKSDYDKQKQLQRESALLAASLIENGGSTLIRHGGNKKFLNSGDGHSPDVSQFLQENAKWDLQVNKDGSVHLRSKDTGLFLHENADGHLELSKEPLSSWYFSRSPSGKEAYIINKLSGHSLQQSAEGKLFLSPTLDPVRGVWKFQTEQDKLAAALAGAVASSGGNAQIQHGWSQAYVNGKPALSVVADEKALWSLALNPDGTLSLKNKENGKFLSQGEHDQVGLSENDQNPSAHWNVARGPDGGLFFTNKATGQFLTRTNDGAFKTDSESNGKSSSWTVKTDNGVFNSSSSLFGDAALGSSLAAALAACGGSSLLQHGKTKGYVNKNLGFSPNPENDTQWEVSAHPDGSWTLKNKTNGKFVGLSDDGSIALKDEGDSIVSFWTVSRGSDGNIILRNKATGDYLERGANGHLNASPSLDESKAGWIVKSDNGIFSSEIKDGASIADGYSLRELESKTKSLQQDIESAQKKVKEETTRREHLNQELENLREYIKLNELRSSEADKTLSELTKKLQNLQNLFDAEHSQKLQIEAAKASAEKVLSDKESLLRDLNEKRENLMKQLEVTKSNAEREIAVRKQREAEIRALEQAKSQLQKKIVISGKTLAGLDSLKRNLEEHLSDLSTWYLSDISEKDKSDVFEVDQIAKELEGKGFEDQISFLSGKLKDENKCLLRIFKFQDGSQKLEEKTLREGWLFIKGRKDWKQRWCVLSGQLLRYYNSEDTTEAADGCVDLSVGCDVVRQKAMKEGKGKVWPLKLSINATDEEGNEVVRKLFLRAATKAERHSWFTSISCMTTRLNYLMDVEKSGERPDTRVLTFISAGEATPIHELFCDNRPISASGSSALYKGILYHDNLKTLSLQNDMLGDVGVHKLCTALDKVTELRVLRLSGNQLTSDSVAALVKALCVQNTSLRELDLSHNAIDAAGIQEIEALFTTNTQLNILNLSSNQLGDEGVTNLTLALAKLPTHITSLDLANNKIGNAGASAIAKLLSVNSNIAHVRLSGNNIGNEGAAELAQAIRSKPNVLSVDLSSNDIGPEGVLAFKDTLTANAEIASVDFSQNPKLVGSRQLEGILNVDGFSVSSLTIVQQSA